MKKQRGSAAEIFIVFLIIIVTILAFVFDNLACKAKWERSGMARVTWGPIQGCLVKLPDGRWLPEERIREIDIPKEPKK